MNPLARIYPYTGNQVDVTGVVMVYYFGLLIAIFNGLGTMIFRDAAYPLFLINYLLRCPDHNPVDDLRN